MVSKWHSSAEAEHEPIAAGRFRFISIQGPDEAKDRITRRLARSHAVKQGLKNKRKHQQEVKDNFRVTTSKHILPRLASKNTRTETPPPSVFCLSAGAFDPFQTLAVDSSRLQTLLGDYNARQAPEPVFSVAQELAFQNFRSVFRTGFVDPALMNALMLSLAFAVTGGNINQECLGYQGRAFSFIREKMDSPEDAISESTIGAILLLAGVEARLGMTSHVQLHMKAVQQLLETCKAEGVYLTGGIKRAIFWQDLNSSILAGSTRIVSHTTFAELQWKRDPFCPSFFRLPPGFQKRSDLFTAEFLEVLEDINALQCIRDLSHSTTNDVVLMANINNHTASIQSRLVELPNCSPVLECCHAAAYICSVMLCCKVWCALVIPSHISLELLRKLQQANGNPIWDDHPELLLWLLYMGGSFASKGSIRSEYVVLLKSNDTARFRDLYRSWPELVGILKQFIWSEKGFKSQVKAFWEECVA